MEIYPTYSYYIGYLRYNVEAGCKDERSTVFYTSRSGMREPGNEAIHKLKLIKKLEV